MSRPIGETPILKGKDAKRFMENMKKAETEVIPPDVRKRMKENYLALKAIEVKNQ